MLPFSYRNFEGNRISSIESGAFQNVQGPGCTLYVLMSYLKLIIKVEALRSFQTVSLCYLSDVVYNWHNLSFKESFDSTSSLTQLKTLRFQFYRVHQITWLIEGVTRKLSIRNVLASVIPFEVNLKVREKAVLKTFFLPFRRFTGNVLKIIGSRAFDNVAMCYM